MALKAKEKRPQGFFPTLIICVVVAFIIIHSAFLKLTSSPDAEKKKELRTPIFSVRNQHKEPSQAPDQILKKIPSSPSLKNGYHFHRTGDFGKAAAEYAKVIKSAQHKNDFTVQLLLACQEDTIVKAFKNTASPEHLYYIPWPHNGRGCFKVCMGFYKSKGDAEKKLRRLSKHFLRGGNRPVAVSVSALAKGLEIK